MIFANLEVLLISYAGVGTLAAAFFCARTYRWMRNNFPTEWDQYFIPSRKDCYLAALLLWDTAGQCSRTEMIIGGVLVAAFWPVGAASLLFYGFRQFSEVIRERLTSWTHRRLKKRTANEVNRNLTDLDAIELVALADHLVDLQSGLSDLQFSRLPVEEINARLEKLWLENHEESGEKIAGQIDSVNAQNSTDQPRFSRGALRVPDSAWGFHMTHYLQKSIVSLDKNIRARALDAINELCINPLSMKGDTIRPLKGEFAGLWRYRFGDYRLIYRPDKSERRIDLISIRPRGSVYM